MEIWKKTSSAEVEFQIALQHLHAQQTWALSQNGRCGRMEGLADLAVSVILEGL